jgi:hypothetical protein
MLDLSHIPIEEHITGSKFELEMSDTPSVFYQTTDNVRIFLETTARYIKKPFILVTHNSDLPVTDELVWMAKRIPNIKKWFGQNISCSPNDLILSLPIGLENDKWFPELQKRKALYAKAQLSSSIRPTKLLYLNFSFWTNTSERTVAHQILARHDWSTDHCREAIEQVGYNNFLDSICSHQYVLCPRGNGIDTHRLWETLYLGRIPIVKRDTNNRYYEDLPILFVDEWGEVTEQLLRDNIDWFSIAENFNTNKLKFSWWKERITTILKDLQ